MSLTILAASSKLCSFSRSNFDRAPLFTGQIQGSGPRYCPSIEDKLNDLLYAYNGAYGYGILENTNLEIFCLCIHNCPFLNHDLYSPCILPFL